MTVVVEAPRSVRSGTVTGIVDMAPIALGILPFATMIGVTIAEGAVSDTVGFLGGLLVAGGSAHLAVVGAIDVGAGILAAVVTAAMIQARGIAYGAALAPRLAGQPAWFRWLASYLLVDQMFVLGDAAPDRGDRWFRRYYLSAGAVLWAGYFAGVGAGMVLGPVIPEGSPLPIVVPMLFAAMLGPTLSSLRSVVAASVAIATGLALGPMLPDGAGMVLAIVAGTAAGVVTGRLSDD
jgi:predicted branched-subunit amino acid permease